MNDETLIQTDLKRSPLQPGDRLPTQQSQGPADKRPAAQSASLIAIASTFTADLLRHPLKVWMETLDIPADVLMAPYAQLMQELLDQESLLSRNKTGFNILLIRPEDWIRDRPEEGVEQNLRHIHRAANDLAAAVGVIRARTSASIFVFLCPSSSSLPFKYRQSLEEIERDLMTRLSALEGVHCWIHADLVRLYPIINHEDRRADRIAHIPYTNEYFAAIATLLARRIAALTKSQFKVIAVDCDNTLWKGVCGEDGAAGIDLTVAHLEFQRMLIRQHDAGMLLCLCSKNNESDVDAVFRGRPDMLLRKDHLVCSRVNWSSKSSNLKSLSQELGLSLDSFILVDDSPIECAEVRGHCPSVLALQFPETPEEIAHFLDHAWAFDRIGATQEAKHRTAQYKQNRARDSALEGATDVRQFLLSLDLKVDISLMQYGELARVTELIQRTNQFNLTGIRRRSSEIEALWSSEKFQILVVRVRDRFGDYGLVGAIFFHCEPFFLDVDTFVLSCRALGRGVEHRIVSELGRIARENGLPSIVLKYRPTPRNAPAAAFLERSLTQFRSSSRGNGESSGDSIFMLPVEYAESLGNENSGSQFAKKGAGPTVLQSATQSASSTKWHEAAYRVSYLADIVREINRSAPIERCRHREHVAPRTATEAVVGSMYAEVLGLQEVSIRDDFFELGGDSLLAVQVISRIDSLLGLELSLHEFLEEATVEEVAAKLARAPHSGAPIERCIWTDPLPLSSAQQRLLFIDQLEGGSAAYHIPLAVRLVGELDRAALQAALDTLVKRHEMLRAVFTEVNGQPVQEITSDVRFALRLVDLRAQAIADREAEVLRQSREELAAPYDLGVGPPIRGRLLQLSEDEHVLLITMHHIVSDGWSIGVLIRELGVLYEAYSDCRSDPLPPLPIRYSDYAQWQRKLLEGAEPEEQLGYWREHLQAAPELLELPTDRPRPAVQSYRGADVRMSIGSDLAADLKALARRFNLTLSMTLYAAWSIVLSRLSGQQDIVVGIPVANRRRTELEGIVGFFVNTLSVRVRLEDGLKVSDLLLRVREIMWGAYAHQDIPFEKVVAALQPARSLSYSPIFQVMFVMQTASRGVMQLRGLMLEEQQVPFQTAQFDLMLSLQESADGIIGSLNYATDLFDFATIERWIGYFKSVLTGMVREAASRVDSLRLMGERERQLVIEEFNATQAFYPQEELIHRLFEEQVERTPAAVAVVYEGQSLTYSELSSKANQLARYLKAKGVGPDQLVGVCAERSLEMVVGLLGILKAGGAYVPLDPHYPAERLDYMLKDAAPKVLLIQRRLLDRIPETASEIVALDGDWEKIAKHGSGNLDSSAMGLRSRHLAYVIYTSGSTGHPKGVMIEHRSVVNLWHGLEDLYRQSTACQRIALNASINFDASVQQIVQLLCGRIVFVLSPETRRDASKLLSYLRENQIEGIDCTPSQLKSWISEGLLNGNRHPLRLVLVGGEPIDGELWSSLAQCPEMECYNVYGPTECTVDATAARLKCDTTAPHLGRPMENRRIYIVDRYSQPVPIGVAGEIHIGGAGVARGYLNRIDLTAERFVLDPFSPDPQARLYKTGDLGRWRADGTIEYLGRNDRQVKIRGFRIELGEIEAQLSRHQQVGDALVTAREDVPGEKRLVAYLVPANPSDAAAVPSVKELRSHLQTALPEYMVPSAFVMLERFPLTPNGKLDRTELPAPEIGAYASREYETPQGEVEETLAGIWQELLRVQQVGRDDDFFELGGHSLLAMQSVARIQSLLSIEVPVRLLFECRTVKQLSERLKDLRRVYLLDKIANGGTEMEDILERVASMSKEKVQELLGKVTMEGAP